jgi:hypothetical protein
MVVKMLTALFSIWWCYQIGWLSRKEVSKREEAYTWPLGTEFLMLTQKRILGQMEVETRNVY